MPCLVLGDGGTMLNRTNRAPVFLACSLDGKTGAQYETQGMVGALTLQVPGAMGACSKKLLVGV